ncbi:hypothetical protein AAHA92_05898 [Salvia divinorum]|uniref:Uncharacterized protein n=1 Tax=Salvia divinorum TaxID=28513 RepID=A0ABD1I3W3_SALDI
MLENRNEFPSFSLGFDKNDGEEVDDVQQPNNFGANECGNNKADVVQNDFAGGKSIFEKDNTMCMDYDVEEPTEVQTEDLSTFVAGKRHDNPQDVIVQGPLLGLRSRTEKRVSSVLSSPFNERVVRIVSNMNNEDKDLYYWVLSTQGQLEHQMIYFDKIVGTTKKQFQSLKPHNHVEVSVIDSWASYLNHMEIYKSPASPSRMFLTTGPTLYSVVERQRNWDQKKTLNNFFSNIECQVQKMMNFDWNNYDLTGVAVIIENVVGENKKASLTKYDTDLDLLRDFFGQYLNHQKQNKLADIITSNNEFRPLNLPWQTSENKNDCAIYLMRHMEMYMGVTRGWISCRFYVLDIVEHY